MTTPPIKNKALLYVRVSTSMQVEDGVSLDAQERSLTHAAGMHGFTDFQIIREEGRSGKSISGRPLLKKALLMLETGEANTLIVTRLDRLSRSVRDFLNIIDHSRKYKWRLIMLDLNLDTSSHSSIFVVTIMAAMAEMERGMISERAKDIHKDRREQPDKRWGIDLGPKPLIEYDLRNEIIKKRDAGVSYQAIAKDFNTRGIPTSNGGKEWYASTVRHAYLAYLKSQE